MRAALIAQRASLEHKPNRSREPETHTWADLWADAKDRITGAVHHHSWRRLRPRRRRSRVSGSTHRVQDTFDEAITITTLLRGLVNFYALNPTASSTSGAAASSAAASSSKASSGAGLEVLELLCSMEGETWDALVRRVIRAEQRELDALGDARSNASATAGQPHLVALVNPRDVPCTRSAAAAGTNESIWSLQGPGPR